MWQKAELFAHIWDFGPLCDATVVAACDNIFQRKRRALLTTAYDCQFIPKGCFGDTLYAYLSGSCIHRGSDL